MTKYQAGADALNALNREDGGGSGVEFSSFKTGTTYFVKVLGAADLIQFYSYGIFNQINSFVAANPSKKSANGYPIEGHTPWDKAWKYHKDLSGEFSDHHGQEAYKYRAKERYAMGFYDLTSGESIIIDVSKNQAQAINAVITRNEKRLDKLAFELSKQGQGTGTTVSLSPVMFPDEDLTDEQRANLDKAPESFDMELFNGLLYEAEEDEQVKLLTQAGFDVALIGYEVGQAESSAEGNANSDDPENDDNLPF